jgi:hypothetical protein
VRPANLLSYLYCYSCRECDPNLGLRWAKKNAVPPAPQGWGTRLITLSNRRVDEGSAHKLFTIIGNLD